jgi:MFS family permease
LKKLAIVGGGIHFVIMSITNPFFALYASELGASTALIGVLITLKALLPLFIAMPSGQLIDRIGAPAMLRIGSFITTVSLVFMVWSPNLFVLAAAQILVGAGTLLMASSLQVIVSEGEKEERDRNITRYSAWSSGGSMVGPLIGGGIVTLAASVTMFGWSGASELGYKTAFIFSLLLSILFLLAVIHYSGRAERKKYSVREVGRLLGPREMIGSYAGGLHLLKIPSVQFGLLGTFLIHYLQTVWTSFFPLYLNSLGHTAIVISILVSIQGLASLLSRSFLPALIKRFKHEQILISAGCIAALCLMALPALHWEVLLIGVISFILGCAVGVNMPVSSMIMVNDTAQNERGKVMGLRLFTNRASQIAAPATFGVIGQALGLSIAFYAGGGLLLAIIIGYGAYGRVKLRDSKPARVTEHPSGSL